jgi:hypothetical protein
MTNLPVDDENTLPLWEPYMAKLEEIIEQGELCALKTIDFGSLFEGLSCNLTGDKF